MPPIDTEVAVSRLYRRREGRLVAGVAAGIAAHLGLSVTVIRVAFVALLAFNGLGALLYAVFWAVLPVQPVPPEAVQRPGRRSALLLFLLLAIAVLTLRGLVGGDQLAPGALGWLVALIAIGVAIIWHQTGGPDGWRRERGASDPADRRGEAAGGWWLGAILTEHGRRAYVLRFVGGGALIAIGTVGLAAYYTPVGGGSIAAVLNGLLFAILALAGVALVAAPLLYRMFEALREEREARIREQERAEFAAMVHDEVLHTLALIQRNVAAGSPAHKLARAQERTLRGWLYKPTGSPTDRLAAALEQAGGEVEDAYGVTVEVVVVGDLAIGDDERVRALVGAAREALVNAARHAEVTSVSLYAEVEPEQVTVFVRDRGVGFDPAAVDTSRHGLRGSIIGRMARHGGHAEVISQPGEGTEVRLRLPLPAATPTGGGPA